MLDQRWVLRVVYWASLLRKTWPGILDLRLWHYNGTRVLANMLKSSKILGASKDGKDGLIQKRQGIRR